MGSQVDDDGDLVFPGLSTTGRDVYVPSAIRKLPKTGMLMPCAMRRIAESCSVKPSRTLSLLEPLGPRPDIFDAMRRPKLLCDIDTLILSRIDRRSTRARYFFTSSMARS